MSGIIGAYGGLTVVLAVVFRGESLTTLQVLGTAVSTLGVVLTGIAFEGGLRAPGSPARASSSRSSRSSCSPLMTIGSDIVIDHTGWLETLLVSRSANAILSILVLLIATTRLRGRAGPMLQGEDADGGRMRGRVLLAIILAGVLDVLGLLSFAYGLEVAETWLVGLASSSGRRSPSSSRWCSSATARADPMGRAGGRARGGRARSRCPRPAG